MSSYLSNLLTQTTSRYNNLRRTLLSNEDDGDTDDDSHISRVLRAYYNEKGRPYPPWLPPDPNDRRAITPQPSSYSNLGSSYFSSGRTPATSAQAQTASGQRGSLSDLWDTPSNNAATQQPQSLRNARRPMAPPTSSTLAAPQARPLPSQRAGSYQSMTSQQGGRPPAQPTPNSTSAGGGTAQDRLKARLWGGRGGPPPSPGLSQVGNANPYDQPGVNANQGQYDRAGGGQRYGR
nr:hypothetical protein CFP56_28503 [Quercus suber]